jgi:hypothetical protein
VSPWSSTRSLPHWPTCAVSVAASIAGGVVDDIDMDELEDQLWRSLRRPLHCVICNVTFIRPREGLAHLRLHESKFRHPSSRSR